jgi:hypothetical protein
LRQAAAERVTYDFLGGDARVFLDGNANIGDRSDDLREIATRAADLAYRIWTQRSRMAKLDVHDLVAELATKKVLRFQAQSRFLENHPLHRAKLEKDENALDGTFVAVVSHPAVVVFDDSEGQDYSKCKVWKKAVVWMLP